VCQDASDVVASDEGLSSRTYRYQVRDWTAVYRDPQRLAGFDLAEHLGNVVAQLTLRNCFHSRSVAKPLRHGKLFHSGLDEQHGFTAVPPGVQFLRDFANRGPGVLELDPGTQPPGRDQTGQARQTGAGRVGR